ncbi:MAG: hypothetical protein SVM86_02665 [Candidatus Cloacimonadota bacterium]|nr:hypothetical protein [Candidatus Cloacimonadota bacterium]
MKEFCKKLFKYAIFAAVVYFGFKLFERIKSAIEISKTLPQYLENVVGEKPKMNVNVNFSKAEVSLGFSKEVIEKHSDLESIIKEYIEDFYPAVPTSCVNIDIYSID